MIRIEPDAWTVMVDHARTAFPKECCGVMLGSEDADGTRAVSVAIPCRNAYEGDQKDRFLIDPKDQLGADRKAREMGLTVLGFFHSHPNEASYFSATDLKNSWPWYSNVVLSIRDGKFSEAKSFIANDTQTVADPEPLSF
ncbi:MAG: M67 family metallopeptidase [Bryobacterales bacterium]|nr:M67 family metallopeptidase [Bryobacterales bacterium]